MKYLNTENQQLKTTIKFIFLVVLLSSFQSLSAKPTTNFSLFSHLHFNRFEQQIKSEVGGEKGDLLTEDVEISLHFGFEYSLLEHWSLGLFIRFDQGTRELGQFDSLDSSNQPVIVNNIGGAFSEAWLGPYAGFRRGIFAVDLGYGLLGFRDDKARDDIKNINGESNGSFRTSLSVAWFISAGLTAPLLDFLDLSIRFEYRIRYYEFLDNKKLMGDIAHGTQNITPFIGIHWKI